MKSARVRNSVRGAFVALATATGAMAIPTSVEAGSKSPIVSEYSVGFFYSTFDQSPNIGVLAGGTAEEFCLDNPDDPFNAEPGVSESRTFVRKTGQVGIAVNDPSQPIYLYEQPDLVGPEWIESVCAAFFDDDPATEVPQPFASGTAKLKVRIKISSDGTVDVFNAVRGRVLADDGTHYRVFASADLIVEDGVPVGNPADFVTVKITRFAGPTW